jgi:hypothetical protein
MASELVGAYQALSQLALAQRQALESEDLDAFWRLSDEREATFQVIQGHGDRLEGLASPEQATIAQLIPAVLDADAMIEKRLGELASQTQHELGRLKTGLSALQSYAVDRNQEAYFIDRNS